jgi:hypothetical protein
MLRHDCQTNDFLFLKEFSSNIFEKGDCIKSIESVLYQRTYYIKMKITFRRGQEGAVHFSTFSFFFCDFTYGSLSLYFRYK